MTTPKIELKVSEQPKVFVSSAQLDGTIRTLSLYWENLGLEIKIPAEQMAEIIEKVNGFAADLERINAMRQSAKEASEWTKQLREIMFELYRLSLTDKPEKVCEKLSKFMRYEYFDKALEIEAEVEKEMEAKGGVDDGSEAN